jgi:hypothetical protein
MARRISPTLLIGDVQMAVLIEGLSVLIRCRALAERYIGGLPRFVDTVPNGTLRADGALAAVTFMTPDDARAYVATLVAGGLTHLENDRARDLVVVDQRTGCLSPCDWAVFGSVDWESDPDKPVVVCSIDPQRAQEIVVPDGWDYARSLSAEYRFVPIDDIPNQVEKIAHDAGVDIYRVRSSGERLYAARSTMPEAAPEDDTSSGSSA